VKKLLMISHLESIGFVWAPRSINMNKQWETTFHGLVEYKVMDAQGKFRHEQ
jgi:hypothetical protein